MPYIDKDLAIKRGANELGKRSHKATIDVANALYEMPNADVVPKREVAREIFEEIEKAVEDAEFEWGTIYGVKLCLAELKKKYIEEN